MVSVMVGESVVSCTDAAWVNAAPTVAVNIPALFIIVGVSLAGAIVDISITDVGNPVGDASGAGVLVETGDTFIVKVGGAVGAMDWEVKGRFPLPPVIKRTRITAKSSRLPALKTNPFRFVGKKRNAINVRTPNKPAHAKWTKKTSTPFGQMPATPLPKPKPPALRGRKNS